jgi:hypothetical protein
MNQMQQQNQQMLQQMQNTMLAAMSSTLPTVTNTTDLTPNIRSSVSSLQTASSTRASSSETPTHSRYLRSSTPTSFLLSSPARNDVEQFDTKLSAFIEWLQGHYPAVTNAFADAELLLTKENYNFKLLKYVLLDDNVGHTKLHRIGLTYGLIDRMVNSLEDFKVDWQHCNAAAEILLDVSIDKHSV